MAGTISVAWLPQLASDMLKSRNHSRRVDYMRRVLRAVHEGDEGHVAPAGAATIAAAGIVLVGIGAANDMGWLAVAGGIVGGLGFVLYDTIHHIVIDKEFFRRTDDKPESK